MIPSTTVALLTSLVVVQALYHPSPTPNPSGNGTFLEILFEGSNRHSDSPGRRSAVSVDHPGIIPWGDSQELPGTNGSLYNSRAFVLGRQDRDVSRFLVYPYSFAYPTPNQTFPDGAFITLAKDLHPDSFRWINGTVGIDLSKSMAVYDSNVAVLRVVAEREGGQKDVTTESNRYCTMFYSWGYPKYDRCFEGMRNHADFVKSNPTRARSSFLAFLSPEDISSGSALFEGGGDTRRFGVLYLPDTLWEEQGYLRSVLAPARSEIARFVESGGVLVTSGVSAGLLEGLGMIPENTVDRRHTMRKPADSWVVGVGCEANASVGDASGEEFVRRMLCFAPHRDSKSRAVSYMISGAMLNEPQTQHGLEPLMHYDTSARDLRSHDMVTGFDSPLPLENATKSYPMLMWKQRGQGYIVVALGQPASQFHSAGVLYNAFWLSASRPLALDVEVLGGIDKTVPALEHVKVAVSLKITNYFTLDVPGTVEFRLWTRNGTTVTPPPGACRVVAAGSESFGVPPSSSMDRSSRFDCSFGPLGALSSRTFSVGVEITDPLVTQTRGSTVLLWPQISYVDPHARSGSTTPRRTSLSQPVTVATAMAALLRADMNIDPSSTYPWRASGAYVDNVMNCENKEETPATNVAHRGIVPLVSIVVDGDSQTRLARSMVFDAEYYKKSVNRMDDWRFPMVKDGLEYLEWDLLANRTDFLAANWDEAVKVARVPRSSFPSIPKRTGVVPNQAVPQADYQVTNDDDRFVLRQAEFSGSDMYYQHATQRMMPFLDVASPGAARTVWGGSVVPEAERSQTRQDRGKTRVIFARNDVFFWGDKYVLPDGVADNHTLVTLDRYSPQPPCGSPSRPTVPGQYGNSVQGGIVPTQFPNVMKLDCSRRPVSPGDLESSTGGRVGMTHYLVPVGSAEDGVTVGDFDGFDEATGELRTYPEVRFVVTWAASFDVEPQASRHGGEMLFRFAEPAAIGDVAGLVARQQIQFAADQVAVYDTFVGADKLLHVRFKRGNMPNEAFGRPSHLKMYIEGLPLSSAGAASTTTATFDLYALKYDVSSSFEGKEDWSTRTISSRQITFRRTGAFSMPALKLSFMLGPTLAESTIKAHELREPFVRYGLYQQELVAHRAVHGSAEFHPKSEPSLVLVNPMYSTVTHVGTSSIPFREFLTTGTSQIIPAAFETGRVEWTDLWGRQWKQPVRSTIFEYVPIPPPLRNFEMTTTFEVLDKQGRRVMDWRSEEEVDVRVQMKLINNYPKWFEVTNCKANEVLEQCGVSGKVCNRPRLFDPDFSPAITQRPPSDSERVWATSAHNASYGSCFRDAEVWLSGVKTTADMRKRIQQMTLCGLSVGDVDLSCQNLVKDLPTLRRRAGNTTEPWWNWAQQVLDHWPQGYITPEMWDLTHYDYDDTQFDKAYKYHMDNNLPHLSGGISKPENIVAFPLFKGFGYSMVYDPKHGNPKFPGLTGWWSDNLQSRDNTVVAGQAKSNVISVGKKEPLLAESEWLDVTELEGVAEGVVKKALGNVHTCLFNRRIPKFHAANPRTFHNKNVYENNVIPIDPSMSDSWLSSFKCEGTPQYSPRNVSLYPNIVRTDTPRDWLYFAATLRGGARENINVLYTLSPLAKTAGGQDDPEHEEDTWFEGLAKVQDGGRFVYWNPANSRNSFLVVDNPVSVISAVRNDLVMTQELIPSYVTTFRALLFQHLTLRDPAEERREWRMDTYTKNHGYGDFVVSVFVGDGGTSCILRPPELRTRVKITFMNNAGFDVRMRKDAINCSKISQEKIDSYDLMEGLTHTVRYPEAYNFLDVKVPEELRPYVKLSPSQDVVGVAGLFFDFDSINVVTIRDGWKADYYLDLTLAATIPDTLRGRLHHIPVALRPEYFDQLPGVGDPTGVHDYKVTMPDIVVGIPYEWKHPKWPGKVFWTSGYSTNLHYVLAVPDYWVVESARFVDPRSLGDMRKCLGVATTPSLNQTDGEFLCLERAWAKINSTSSTLPCNFTVTPDKANKALQVDLYPGLVSRAPQFPVKAKAGAGPDESELHLLLRVTAPQVPSGAQPASYWTQVRYSDFSGAGKARSDWSWNTVSAKGAWLKLSWSASLLSLSGMPLAVQEIQPGDSGLIDFTVVLSNTGDYVAYNANFTLILAPTMLVAVPGDARFDYPVQIPEGCSISATAENTTALTCRVGSEVGTGKYAYKLRLQYSPDSRRGAGAKSSSPLNVRDVAESAYGFLDLTKKPGERTIRQELSGYSVKYATTDFGDCRAVLSGHKSGDDLELEIHHKVVGVTYYLWRSRLPGTSAWETWTITSGPSTSVNLKEHWKSLRQRAGKDLSGYPELDVIAVLTRTMTTPTLSDLPLSYAETNVYKYRRSSNAMLLLLLILPAVLVPALIGSGVLVAVRGSRKEPVASLGYGRRQAFVPREIDEEVSVVQVCGEASRNSAVLVGTESAPISDSVVQVEGGQLREPLLSASSGEDPKRSRPLPTGPTYMRGGRPINIVDSKN